MHPGYVHLRYICVHLRFQSLSPAMSTMREGAVRCLDPHGFHWVRYVEWGDAKNPRVLVCVHGLTRNARDFDYAAAQWRHLALHVAKQDDHGKWRFRYDPGIGRNFHAAPPADIDLRPYWQAVHGPVLVIRGEHSDLLTRATLDEMLKHPHTQSYVVADTGHAPMLMDDAQAGGIRRFLLR